jgi:hypothetical protein
LRRSSRTLSLKMPFFKRRMLRLKIWESDMSRACREQV